MELLNDIGVVFSSLAGGFATALHPINMAMLFVAVVLGLVIGVLPGLGGTSGVAILLPITVFIAHGSLPGSDATTAIIFLAGIYWGALFGGVITSILFNIPGEPWAVVLLFDGFPLAKKLGKPGLALASSFVSSFLGALVSTILFTFFALPIALKALEFGPAELFAVFVLSFATLIGLGAEAPMKSVAMLALGLLLAAVGFDTITGEQRLNFGQVSLLSGIGFVPVTIGLFGIGEILASAEEQGIGYVENISAKLGLTDVLQALRELRKRLRLVLSNAIIGFFFGVLPGHGATAASFLGYGLARQYSKNKENFGKGEISGIMGPQAAADSAGVASLVPMITLGIPGSPTSAVIMAGLFIWGLQPGPVLFIQHPDFVWGLIASIYLGHLLTFVLCLLAVPLLAMIMRVPYAIITPFIVVISIIGSYSLNNSMLDVFITVVFGVIGYWLRKMKYPLAPLVVALVLGDSTERELRKALIAGHGSPLYFFNSGLSTALMLAALGTATPETLIPVVAILFTNSADADEIGVGAILGAPFMLGTLVMLLIGVTAFVFRVRRKRVTLHVDAGHASRDLIFFLVLYTIALGLALLPPEVHFLKGYLGWVFLPSYFVYLFLVLRAPRRSPEDIEEELEEREAFDELTFAGLLERTGLDFKETAPPLWLVLTQTIVAFAAILVGARFFA